jgi:hypothetical protein
VTMLRILMIGTLSATLSCARQNGEDMGASPATEPGDGDCKVDADCTPTYECVDARACQGIRINRVCADFVCTLSETAEDDSACNGEIADECGFYKDVVCADEKSSESPGQCASTCSSNEQCDPDHVCVHGFPDNDSNSCFPPCAADNNC